MVHDKTVMRVYVLYWCGSRNRKTSAGQRSGRTKRFREWEKGTRDPKRGQTRRKGKWSPEGHVDECPELKTGTGEWLGSV